MTLIGPRVPWHRTTGSIVIVPEPPGVLLGVKWGVTLGLFPSNPAFTVEVWRSTQSSTGAGSSSKWSPDHTMGAGMNSEVVVQDLLSPSTKLWYWRARQTHTGYSAGPWTTVVSARPYFLGFVANTNAPSFGSTALRAVRTISTADNTLTTGILHGSSGVQRILTFPAAAFIPVTSTGKWSFSVGGRLNNFSTGIFTYMAPMPMPQGVKITQFNARIQFGAVAGGSTQNTMSVKLYKANVGTGLATAIVTLSTNGHTSGVRSLISSAMSEVTGSPTYTAVVTMTEAAFQIQGMALINVGFTYTRTQVQQSY